MLLQTIGPPVRKVIPILAFWFYIKYQLFSWFMTRKGKKSHLEVMSLFEINRHFGFDDWRVQGHLESFKGEIWIVWKKSLIKIFSFSVQNLWKYTLFEVIFMCASKIAMAIWYVGGRSAEISLLIDLIFVITYAYTSHDRLSRLDDCSFKQSLFASIITRSAIALLLVVKNSDIRIFE